MISQLALLSRWEWYKLSRRRMPWVLLIIALAVPQVVLWGSFSVFQFSDATRGVFVLPSSLLTALRTSYTTGVILIIGPVLGSGWVRVRMGDTADRSRQGPRSMAVSRIESAAVGATGPSHAAAGFPDRRHQQSNCCLSHHR